MLRPVLWDFPLHALSVHVEFVNSLSAYFCRVYFEWRRNMDAFAGSNYEAYFDQSSKKTRFSN